MYQTRDEKYKECPTACVECNKIVPLNRYRVCEECWENYSEDWDWDSNEDQDEFKRR